MIEDDMTKRTMGQITPVAIQFDTVKQPVDGAGNESDDDTKPTNFMPTMAKHKSCQDQRRIKFSLKLGTRLHLGSFFNQEQQQQKQQN